MSLSIPARLWAWSGLGLAGSVLIALCAPHALADPVVRWWYRPQVPASLTLLRLGMGIESVAWLAILREVRRAGPDGEAARAWIARRAALVVAAWALPLVLAPPLFSRDVYSYLAQGTILHLHHDPYRDAPTALAAVSPFWRHTTAPYGPLFLSLESVIAGICGQHLVVGVLLSRVLDLVGLVLVAVHVPRLTRALRSSSPIGTWLALASPLVLLGLVAAGHNDLLMDGLLLAGVSSALRGNPLVGVGLCSVAATIKLPALAGAVFIVACWMRAEPATGARVRLAAAGLAVMLAVLAVVTLIAGTGLHWLSAGVFSTPAKVRLAITPATAVGYTVASLLHDAGVHVSASSLEAAAGDVAAVLVACAGAVLLWRARVPRLVAALGTALLLAAAGGPAAWPWYLTWGLLLLCACPAPQRSLSLAAPLVAGALVVAPDGILVLSRPAAPFVLVVYIVLAAAAVAWARRGRGSRHTGMPPLSPEVAGT